MRLYLVVSVSMVLLLLSLSGCSPCRDKTIAESRSPDGSRMATASSRDCGATTSEQSRVVLRPTLKNSSEIEQVVFSARYEHKIDLSWRSSSELVVRCDTCRSEDITFQLSKFAKVRINYELP